MKKHISAILAVFLLFTGILTGSPKVYASTKAGDTRAIAIVFDNSGSMYSGGKMEWCRATYAMEVFASMLNKGDTLLIYPMSPIEVSGKEYTMEDPLQLTDASQASLIRDIYTPYGGTTPIESVDCAAAGIQTVTADKKYMIVLTDGDLFYKNDRSLGDQTKAELDARFQKMAGKALTVMYLGIGSGVTMPDTAESEYFVKKKAANSEDVLSSLTDMCNQIFGRDTLPKNHLTDNTMDFDISMNKLIVFVQGENVSDLKVTGASGTVGQLISTATTKYSTKGTGRYDNCVPDTSLQGMMVTYADCAAGSYTIDYTGTATSVEVYYEPDADLDFVFTDAAGNNVDPNALYEGEYKVSFGMKDGKTGKLIDSDLLGNPHYLGSYSVNGEKFPIDQNGYNGEVCVKLNMGDSFDAGLTVTYLSGYTITKDSSDFGWPEGGIKVSARPAGEFRLEITGGQDLYSLQDLEEGTPYIAKIFYDGEQLTGEELKNVDLRWEPDTSNAEIRETFAEDHYDLSLHYKDPSVPQNTGCGECTVTIYAHYTAKGSSEAQAQAQLTYNIEDDFSPLQIDLHAPQDYIVISELEDCEPIVVKLTMNGAPLTPEDFQEVELLVDCGGIDHTVTANAQDSAYRIKLLPTEGIAEDDYSIHVKALYTDHIGRTTETEDSLEVTLSNIPLWVKWLIGLLLLLLLIIIILLILHIKVLPTKAHVTKRESSMIFDGEDESKNTQFEAKIEKGQMVLFSKYAGTKTGLSMDVKPGKESYLRKPQARRSAEVKSASVKKLGTATIHEASIGSIRYALNEETNRLERMPKNDKPFLLKHGMRVSYSGTMMNAGIPKPFTVTTKLNFKKK